MTKHPTHYAIRARFIGDTPPNLEYLSSENGVYLGKRGQWASVDRALLFRSVTAAENALQEKWTRLHNTGNKSVILSVVRV